jgi:lipid II:glycine glycyltransferase (peptidoglycan interpeptide bridge formation enzyme)
MHSDVMMAPAPPALEPVSDAAFSVSVDETCEAEWNRVVTLFDDASFYQTWAYGAVSWGEGQLSHLVLRKGDQIVAAAQVRIVKVPLLSAGVAYLRWGPLWRRRGTAADTGILEAAIKAIVEVYSKERGLLLRVIPNMFCEDPLAGEASAVWKRCGFSATDCIPLYRTIRVDLTPEPNVLRKQLDQKWRNQLNGAERNSLAVVSGAGDDMFERFLRIYDEMMKRKQFHTTVDPREFAAMQRRLPPEQKMVVMLAEKDGEAMAGLISASVGSMGIYLHGATSDEGMKFKGSYLLQWRMMNHLREAGCRWYDLGGINPETNPGVYHFKQGFGGQECRQTGGITHPGSGLSMASVLFAERLQRSWRRAKHSLRKSLRK